MKKLSGYVLTALAASVLCLGCRKASEPNIFTIVQLRVTCHAASADVERLEVDNALEGSFIRDLNTRQDYEIPVFQKGQATVKLRKGVYLIAFDGVATFSDGQRKRVRCSSHNYPDKAVALLEDTRTLQLELTILN